MDVKACFSTTNDVSGKNTRGKTNTDEAAVSKAKIEYQTTTINDDDLNILDMCA